MQDQVRDPVKERGFWRVVRRVARAFGGPHAGDGRGSRPVVVLPLPEEGPDPARARPTPREQAEIRAHRADWP
jgi:hypothetical protein